MRISAFQRRIGTTDWPT